jgi:hypothetical protein
VSKRNPFGIRTLKQYPKALRHCREIAKEHGYAIGLHGSHTYDLDLIAAPWVDECATPDVLAAAIASGLGWYLHNSKKLQAHGRFSYLIYGPNRAHIDLSVMAKALENK